MHALLASSLADPRVPSAAQVREAEVKAAAEASAAALSQQAEYRKALEEELARVQRELAAAVWHVGARGVRLEEGQGDVRTRAGLEGLVQRQRAAAVGLVDARRVPPSRSNHRETPKKDKKS